MHQQNHDQGAKVEEKLKTRVGMLTKFVGEDDFFEKLSSGAVIARLKNRLSGAWLYHLKFGDKDVFNLGVDGSLETAVALAQLSGGQFIIRTKELVKVEWAADKTAVSATVETALFTKGLNPLTNALIDVELVNSFGHFRQETSLIRKRDGRKVPVQHPETQAVSKAERNSRNHLIPKKLRDAIIAEAMVLKLIEEEEEGKGSSPATTRTKASSKSSDTPASKEQIETLGNLLKEECITEAMKNSLDKLMESGKLTASQAAGWTKTMEKKVEEAKRKSGKDKEVKGKPDEELF